MTNPDPQPERSGKTIAIRCAGTDCADQIRIYVTLWLCGAVLILLLCGIARAAVVYDQPPTDTFLRQSSQLGYDRFGSDYDVYVWDDFTLGATESVTEVDWRGVYTSGGYWGGPVIDFVIGIYPSIAGGFQPDVINPPLVEYTVGNNAGEMPPQQPGGVTQSFHDYHFMLPTPFVAVAGTKYWIQIEAIQNGPTDWGLTAASSGSGGIFFAQAGVGDFQYFAGPGDVGFTLFGPAGPVSTPTSTPTATNIPPSTTATATATATATLPPATSTATPSAIAMPVSGHKLIMRDRANDPSKRKILFISTDANVATSGGSAIDPISNGAVLQVYNANGSGESVCLPLPGAGWHTTGHSQRPSYIYRDTAATNGPCRVAAVKDRKLLKVVCAASVRPINYSLDEPTQGAMGVRFASGGAVWCAVFGGDVTQDSGTDPPVVGGKGQFKAKLAPVPASCAAPPITCP